MKHKYFVSFAFERGFGNGIAWLDEKWDVDSSAQVREILQKEGTAEDAIVIFFHYLGVAD